MGALTSGRALNGAAMQTVEVESISKKYLIRNGGNSSYLLFREELVRKIEGCFRRFAKKPPEEGSGTELWALKDVSFQVAKGDVVGIIGRNGAGKSTLLKILSRITSPTEGSLRLRGNVASLLEIGSGFSPELSGAENIYLNGILLGMKRREIKLKFDEIVEFSGLSRFIDTPLKKYSSGMQARLAFSVAAHLSPEILLVDEVLGVGDQEFQKKSLGKMRQLSCSEGRSVLFVSHQLPAVEALTTRCILLERGTLRADGKPRDVISEYLAMLGQVSMTPLSKREDRQGTADLFFVEFTLKDADGRRINKCQSGAFCAFTFLFINRSERTLRHLAFAASIVSSEGRVLSKLGTELSSNTFCEFPGKEGEVSFVVQKLPLPPGRYGLHIEAESDGLLVDKIFDAAYFVVEPGDFFGTGKIPGDGGTFLLEHSVEMATSD